MFIADDRWSCPWCGATITRGTRPVAAWEAARTAAQQRHGRPHARGRR